MCCFLCLVCWYCGGWYYVYCIVYMDGFVFEDVCCYVVVVVYCCVVVGVDDFFNV